MANLNLSEFGEKLFVADADHTFIWDTANAISKRVSRNSWLSAGSIATSTPLTISQTWTDAAVAFAAMKIVATATNSAAGSDFLELYSGTSTQPLRVDINKTGQINSYGTWTDAGNYERLAFNPADATFSNGPSITTQQAGSGVSRQLNIGTTGTADLRLATNSLWRWRISGSTGHLLAHDDNTYDIGAIGANRPRNLYVGSNIYASGNVGIGTTSPTSKLHVVGDAVLTGQLLGGDYTVGTVATATQANISITNNHTGQTNSSVVVTPKGTGAFILGPKPDGTAVGGNARGNYAVDHQLDRSTAADVASGPNSCIGGGQRNVASGAYSVVAGGQVGTASGSNSFIGSGLGNNATAALCVVVGGQSNTATALQSFIVGGLFALADRVALGAQAGGRFAATGDAQKTTAVFRNKTTTNSAVELFLDGASARYTVTSGKIISMIINITGAKSDGSAVAHYVRQYSIKNIGGTTSQVYAAVTVGTDNAAGTSIAISADDTNDSLKIEVTGVASETWRWVASVDAVEVGHGV